MVIIHFAVMNFAEQPFVDDRFHRRNWLEKQHSKQTHVFTFALCTASRIFWQSSQFSASGFFDDHMYWLSQP